MIITRTVFRTALLAGVFIAAPALADGPIQDRGEAAERSHFNRDRETILAMAGDYKVRFDMQINALDRRLHTARSENIRWI